MEEEENSTSKLLNRESLYERFKNGKRPNEKDFEDLINSSINKLDDGISKSFEAGLELAPQGEEGKEVISLYEKLNGEKAHVAACHAGLECGILGTHYPDMEMISFGPNIKGPHSPDERTQISSVQKYWKFVLEILKEIPKR